ncbi:MULTISPECIES: TetR/AcrR family transcriptional regulator [Prauserella salsuginis group]|uniref:AcrR family transcriptional regulator n=2 Tax=Prauserella salsuginis group TaxID=2893672 RepID=A0A839XKL3_9PSEU|nr:MULTISPECIES: TetR/AcrR family transcriptional regulator [Prauserella salsuginis group]MBB3661248.1 AcrR family transcriptional regulator [Prauserella sediminis]
MVEPTETGLPRPVTVAWGMQEVPQRGPNRGLSHERIVAAAIEIADTEGLAAVTMQAVAKSLGFTTMSLYRYVSGKDELLRLMQDAALAVPEQVTLPGDWREALRAWAGLVRDGFRGHPWVLGIPRGQISVLMPNSVRVADLGLAALRELPLDDEEKVGVILMVSQHVTSTVELELSLADEGTVAVSREGLDLLGEVITPERFPHLAPVLQAGHFLDTEPAATSREGAEVDHGLDADYGYGLDLIIAGLEQRVRDVSSGAADDDV